LLRSERAWIHERNNGSPDISRLRQMYLARIAELNAASPSDLKMRLPTAVGQCVETVVSKVSTRLEEPSGAPELGSGSAIKYENGGYQVSYEQLPAIDRSRVGDTVRMCLVNIPQGCPPGDDRGRSYHSTNLRTGESWEAPNAEHMCGGA
jgi:hypothetical protein